MLTELCQYLRNWFDRKPDGSYHAKFFGDFEISGGALINVELTQGQYYRIMGSLFNDGVHKFGDENDALTDEEFNGAIWAMSIPPEVIQLAEDIASWQAKYGGVDSEAMSPFQSESYGGYSYSKSRSSVAASSNGANSSNAWQSAFASRLRRWMKI